MCGIIGYTGYSEASGKLLKGLRVLEYRGYDSAGIAVNNKNGTEIIKCKGRISRLEEKCKNIGCCSSGIGHTRWATHGEVSDINSHPHRFGGVTIVHNGIIENYSRLIEKYSLVGMLKSDTDSEAAAAIIDKFYDKNPINAIKSCVNELEGTFALAVIFDDIKDKIFAVRSVSPIVACKGKDGTYLASDTAAISEYCSEYIVLQEKAVAVLSRDDIKLFDFDGIEIKASYTVLDKSQKSESKGDYPFYMEKEIDEQPQVFRNTLESRIKNRFPDFGVDNIKANAFKSCKSVAVAACGTAMHAGLIGKKLIEDKARIPCCVYIASEFMYSNPIIDADTLFICVSQSGETIDTLEALKYAKLKGATTLAIVNVNASSIARESDYVIYTRAGRETAVASTKAYTTQLAVFYLLAPLLAYEKGKMSKSEVEKFVKELQSLPQKISCVLEKKNEIRDLAKKILTAKNLFMLGRGYDYLALIEASLKLKEISYIHSEAFASGELKHGTLALINEDTPIIALITQSKLKAKEISNIKEVMSRGAEVITFVRHSLNDKSLDFSFELPETGDDFAVVSAVVSLQLLAYYTAFDKGLDVDKPRNLAKVVTVE